MIYGKLVGGELRGAPRPIRTENGDVFTNDPALLLQYGYKPIIMADYPSDGGYYTESWTETESEIRQIWTAAEPSEDISADYPSDGGYYTESWTETESEIKQIWTAAEPPEDISADEALDIITGGADI